MNTEPRDAEFLAMVKRLSQPMLHVGLRSTETGKIVAAGGFTSGINIWPWVVEMTARRWECEAEDVDCDEDDNVRVNGETVARIETGAEVYRTGD